LIEYKFLSGQALSALVNALKRLEKVPESEKKVIYDRILKNIN
jgi:hypothetical protein